MRCSLLLLPVCDVAREIASNTLGVSRLGLTLQSGRFVRRVSRASRESSSHKDARS